MQYITKLFLLVLLFSSQAAYAQKKELKTKFGKISDEEMSMKSCPIDPTAPAVVLFDKGSVRHRYIDNKGRFIQEYERHVRIKIFNKEAYQLADQHIFYFESQKVSDLKATCYNVENGKTVETELEKGNIFDEKLTKTRNLRKFTIPAVKEGSIIEFKYSITSENVVSLPDWTFQRLNVPTLWSEYESEVPTFIEFNKISRGATPFLVAEEEQAPKSFTTSWSDRAEGLNGKSQMHTERVQYDSKIMHFIQENVPALKPEPFMPAPHDFLSQINFDIRAIYRTSIQPVAGAWQITNGGYTEYNNNWTNFGKEMLSDVYEDYLKSSKHTEDTAQKITAGKTTTLEKVTALYEYVGTNFATHKYDMVWLPQSIENIVKFKKGTPAELNILLINMLRKAGVTAYPVLISTRSNGRVNPFRVSPDELNRVIVAVENEDQTVFLVDASAYPNPVGLLDEEDYNNEGLRLKSETDIEWIPITNKISTKSFIVADLSIPTAGGSKGNISITEGGYGAAKHRLVHREKGEKELPALTSKEWATEATLSNIQTENMDKWNEPTSKITFELETDNYASNSGNKIYLTPMIGLGIHENPFKNPERNFNIDLGIPHDETYSITWHIPAGYKVEEQPKSTKMSFGENAIAFEYLIESSSEIVKINLRSKLRKPYIEVENYADLQKFYSEMAAKTAEQIVLTKL